MKKYSFDDLHIGTLKPDGQSLDFRLIPRPSMTQQEWYKFAGSVVDLLNAEATFMSRQFARLKHNGYPRGHHIKVFQGDGGDFTASADQQAGYVTDDLFATPEAAILHAMECAEMKR